MEFLFERREATGALARLVESVWFARGHIRHAREAIAPTGATVAVFVLGDPILHATQGEHATRLRGRDGFLCGPHDRPSLNEPTGETHAYGVVSTPVGCRALFGLDARMLRGRVVPLERWPEGVAIRRSLLGEAPERGLARLLAALDAGSGRVDARTERVAHAVAGLERDPAAGVGPLARRLGVSHAYLDREFRRVVGLGPKRLAAILRVRRLLAELDVHAEVDWSERSHRFGWYDQSHLIRDFKRYTGVTPSAYVAAQRAHFDPSESADAAGFVPYAADDGVNSVQDATPAAGESRRREGRT